MMNLPPNEPHLFDRPGTYKIIISGKIDPTWSDRLEDMAICQATTEAGHLITTLQGKLSDQAALAGVFNTLYELHTTVLSVVRLEKDKEEANPQE